MMSFTFNLSSLNIVTLSNPTRMSWLQPRKGDLHFTLSDNDNYYFDVKVGSCGFMGFVNNVIDYECLEYVFCFRIKEKENNKLYINFYSIGVNALLVPMFCTFFYFGPYIFFYHF